jgi:molybdopterin-guanine dinucleotide biosynthesis protein A
MPDGPGAAPGGGRIANVSAALLVGGASRRMGRDKSALMLAGVPAATRTSRLLAGFFEDVLLVGGDPPEDALGRRVPDVRGPRCALRGVVTALEAVRTDHVLVVATDLPLLTPDLLLALVAFPEADAVVPRDASGRHPLCALYRRAPALEQARSLLREERLAMSHLLDALDTRHLEGPDLAQVDPDGHALTNVNTPEDLARLEVGGGSVVE